MSTIRVIGDVHGQITNDDLYTRQARPYLEIIADAPYSVQVGDMGDGETYDRLIGGVDPAAHRFVPGNHDHYDRLPPHSLGDSGVVVLGGVEFFFVRGAASSDQAKLVQLGQQFGKKLWFAEEELTEKQMLAVEQEYLRVRPSIVVTHDAPAEIASFAWMHARSQRAPYPGARFRPSRTNFFLARLLEQHAPKLWLFGHHHRDWHYREGEALFVCVGELSFVDIDNNGQVLALPDRT